MLRKICAIAENESQVEHMRESTAPLLRMGSKGFTEACLTSQWCIIAEDDAMVFAVVEVSLALWPEEGSLALWPGEACACCCVRRGS